MSLPMLPSPRVLQFPLGSCCQVSQALPKKHQINLGMDGMIWHFTDDWYAYSSPFTSLPSSELVPSTSRRISLLSSTSFKQSIAFNSIWCNTRTKAAAMGLAIYWATVQLNWAQEQIKSPSTLFSNVREDERGISILWCNVRSINWLVVVSCDRFTHVW